MGSDLALKVCTDFFFKRYILSIAKLRVRFMVSILIAADLRGLIPF